MAKLHFLKSVTDTINTSFIIESNGTLIVFDGGFESEEPYLYEYLKGLGGHVKAWFLTHFHDDHFGCFLTMLQKHPDITVDEVCYNFPPDEYLLLWEPKQSHNPTEVWLMLFREAIAARKIPVVTATVGDVYAFDEGNVTVRVLRTYNTAFNYINNSSTVFRVEVDGKSILFLGDLEPDGGHELIETVDHALLKADYVQMAHHGQGGVEKEVYEVVKPTYCLWPTPSWLWDNMGPGGYDTGAFRTVIVRGWISSLRCVKKHYRMTEGTQVIDLAAD
jgi:beta-lactamase superfamily II metal-dependent hydrolase